jgi:glycosyltransferase involved in cell wall biosynthesis
VVSDQVGPCIDINNAGAGIVVRCEVEELTEAMIRLLNNEDLRVSMGRNGTKLVKAKYSQDAVTSEVLDAYERVAN